MADPVVPAITEREQVDPNDRHHYDAIAESRGSVRGPFTVLLHRPELAGRVAELGAYIRYANPLPVAVREAAILATAAEWRSAYVWVAHEPIAREAGVPAGLIEAIIEGEPPGDELAGLAAIVRFARDALRDRRPRPETVESVGAELGRDGLVDLVGTIGYYSMMSVVNGSLGVEPSGPDPFD